MDLSETRRRGIGNEPAVRHPWESARVHVVSRLIRRHVALVPGAVVIDVGCGDSFVVEQLAREYPGVTFYAVDTAFSDGMLEHYRARLMNCPIHTLASVDAIPPLARTASLILVMDVIEHIEDDVMFLRRLCARPFVGGDTIFLITVPAYELLCCSHDGFLGHYRRYSPRMLRERVMGSGLAAIETGSFFFSLLPVRAWQAFRERVLGWKPAIASTGLVNWNGGRRAAAVLRMVLAIDAGIAMLVHRAGLRLPGLSMYAVCVNAAVAPGPSMPRARSD